jgi:uncharacterized membrane protein
VPARLNSADLYLIHRGGRVMLKTINQNMFDVVVALVIIATVFYLAAITHIVPLPENALTRIGEISLNVMDVLLTCFAWLISFKP